MLESNLNNNSEQPDPSREHQGEDGLASDELRLDDLGKMTAKPENPISPIDAPPPVSRVLPTNGLIPRNEVFVTYSHTDQDWFDKLVVYLRVLEQRWNIPFRSVSRLEAGSKRREEVKEFLTRAKVAVLLVSIDFLESDFIEQHQLPPLLYAAEQEGLVILWIAVRPCPWGDKPEITRYTSISDPSKPLSKLSKSQREEIFVKVYEAIKTEIKGK